MSYIELKCGPALRPGCADRSFRTLGIQVGGRGVCSSSPPNRPNQFTLNFPCYNRMSTGGQLWRKGEQTSSRRVPNHNGVGRPVVSWQSNSMATAQWLRRGMGNYEFQEAMRSGHFPIATDEAFRILLARLERAEFDQIRS